MCPVIHFIRKIGHWWIPYTNFRITTTHIVCFQVAKKRFICIWLLMVIKCHNASYFLIRRIRNSTMNEIIASIREGISCEMNLMEIFPYLSFHLISEVGKTSNKLAAFRRIFQYRVADYQVQNATCNFSLYFFHMLFPILWK